MSKAEAEKAAWKWAEEHKEVNVVVVNPYIVLGPVINAKAKIDPSNGIVLGILTGKYPAIMDLSCGIVDVRDVAAAHILGLENPAAKGRHLVSA